MSRPLYLKYTTVVWRFSVGNDTTADQDKIGHVAILFAIFCQ
jgi:hypothetical protein